MAARDTRPRPIAVDLRPPSHFALVRSPDFRGALRAHIERNPHCAQAAAYPASAHYAAVEALAERPLGELPVAITADSPTMPFEDRPDRDRSPLHYGQLKLFLSELRFLMSHASQASVVVYAGAAPGHHIPFIAGCFPTCRFLLYDPAEFCPALLRESAPDNVEVHRGTYFTEEIAADLAREHGSAHLLFVSDVRTGKESACVSEDMDRQRTWVRILQPRASMLKFRLPWGSGVTRYLDGTILLPVYAPLTSTECRLVVAAGSLDRDYDNATYEQACAYHNTVGRIRPYAHGVSVRGLDHCHDCAMFVSLAGEYLRLRDGADKDTPEAIARFITSAIRAFGTGRDLSSEYSRSTTRTARQFPVRARTPTREQPPG